MVGKGLSAAIAAAVELVAACAVGSDYARQGRLYFGELIEVDPLSGGPGRPRPGHLHQPLFDDLLNSHDLDHVVDDFNRRKTGVCGTALLPSAMAARGRAPLRDTPAGSNGHLCGAPSAHDLLPRNAA